MLWGVTIAGPDRWEVDPAEAELRACRELSEDGRVIHNRYDYSALEIQRAIVSKHAAMVRTVNSTDGLVMDVVQGELIMVDSPRAFDHLQMISAAVGMNFDFPLEKLGLFTSVAEDEVKGFDSLVGWAPGQIPEIDQYLAKVGLTHTNMTRQPRLISNPLKEDLSDMPASLFSQHNK